MRAGQHVAELPAAQPVTREACQLELKQGIDIGQGCRSNLHHALAGEGEISKSGSLSRQQLDGQHNADPDRGDANEVPGEVPIQASQALKKNPDPTPRSDAGAPACVARNLRTKDLCQSRGKKAGGSAASQAVHPGRFHLALAEAKAEILFRGSLKAVGLHPFKVEKMSQAFRRHDQTGLGSLYELWDADTAMSSNKAYLARAREHGATLAEMMQADRLQLHDRSERAWTPPPKGYTDHLEE
jgi:hypothetical protein